MQLVGHRVEHLAHIVDRVEARIIRHAAAVAVVRHQPRPIVRDLLVEHAVDFARKRFEDFALLNDRQLFEDADVRRMYWKQIHEAVDLFGHALIERSELLKVVADLAPLICALLEATSFWGTDACVAPINDSGEATADPHMTQRGSFVEIDGVVQPAPAPRFSVSNLSTPLPARPPGADTDRVLTDLGYSTERIAELRRGGVIA